MHPRRRIKAAGEAVRIGGPLARTGSGIGQDNVMGLALSEECARRARVHAQLLDGGSTPRRNVAAVVSEIVGIQAQDVTAAELSIRARTTGPVRDDIHQTLADTRSLVRTSPRWRTDIGADQAKHPWPMTA